MVRAIGESFTATVLEMVDIVPRWCSVQHEVPTYTNATRLCGQGEAALPLEPLGECGAAWRSTIYALR